MESRYFWMVFGGRFVGLFVTVTLVTVVSCAYGYPLSTDGTDDEPAYLVGVKYDEYPMIVPKKRAAMLIDRLMVALQKAIDEEEEEVEAREHQMRTKNMMLKPEDAVRSMDLQRRGHGSLPGQQKGRIYWRCYFNAVTCF